MQTLVFCGCLLVSLLLLRLRELAGPQFVSLVVDFVSAASLGRCTAVFTATLLHALVAVAAFVACCPRWSLGAPPSFHTAFHQGAQHGTGVSVFVCVCVRMKSTTWAVKAGNNGRLLSCPCQIQELITGSQSKLAFRHCCRALHRPTSSCFLFMVTGVFSACAFSMRLASTSGLCTPSIEWRAGRVPHPHGHPPLKSDVSVEGHATGPLARRSRCQHSLRSHRVDETALRSVRQRETV